MIGRVSPAVSLVRRSVAVLALLCGSVTLAAQSSKIPTPESVVGFAPGAESKLATYGQTIEYFKKVLG